MRKDLFVDQLFQNEHFTDLTLPKGEYENCRFSHCVFANADLSDIIFADCEFEHCDLSSAKMLGTVCRDLLFKDCKLLGVSFSDCKNFLLGFHFQGCMLNYASFYKLNIKNTHFDACKMEEVDFIEADLTGAVFNDCDLRGAIFEQTKLEGADFRTAYNIQMDPEINSLRKAKFSAQNVAGLLGKYGLLIE